MVFEGIDEVVGGAHGFHVQGPGEEGLGPVGVGGELRIDGVEDLFTGLRAQELFHAEVAFQVQVDPLVDGVPGEFGEDFGQCEEFFLRRGGLAGDEGFGHAPLPHDLPHVVVGGGEKLPGVAVAGVVGDLLHVGVVVGIHHGEVFHAPEDLFPRRVGDEIAFVHEGHDDFLLIRYLEITR